jgi:hypothetical protein
MAIKPHSAVAGPARLRSTTFYPLRRLLPFAILLSTPLRCGFAAQGIKRNSFASDKTE